MRKRNKFFLNKSKIIVELEVYPVEDDEGWGFAVATLKDILNSIFDKNKKKWDYNFNVVKVFRVDEETRDE